MSRKHSSSNEILDVIDLDWILEKTGPLRSGHLAVFDIDSTIMDTAPRNLAILREAEAYFPTMIGAADSIGEEGMGWNVCDSAAEFGKLSARDESVFRQFWADRFFASPYLLQDRPYPGVRELLEGLLALGVEVDYLTGRDEEGMKDGTLESFRQHGIPTGNGTNFVFKPRFEDADLVFKTEISASLVGNRSVVLAVENEPANANMFRKLHPEALVLLIDTITAPNPEPLIAGIHRFRSFRTQ